MNDRVIEELYYFYRILTMSYKREVNSSSIFLDYIYNMDIMLLKEMARPYLWEDYIFIDDDLINEFKSNILLDPIFNIDEFDNLSEFSHDCLNKIMTDELVKRIDMIHTDYINPSFLEYYIESRDISLYFLNDKYQSKLIERKRDILISKLID